MEEKAREALVRSIKFNDFEFILNVNEEEAIEVIKYLAKKLKKDLWYKKGNYRNDLFDVYTSKGLREEYKDTQKEFEDMTLCSIETFDEWKNKYFKIVKKV